MADENALKDEAKKIEKLVAANEASDISLNQPYPQEIAEQKGPIAEIVAEHEIEAAKAEEKQPPKPPDQPAPPPKTPEEPPKPDPEEKEEKPPESESEAEPAKAGGYTVGDILQAPVKPPENLEGEPKSATKYPKVKFLVGTGIALFFLGVLFFLMFDQIFGFVVAFVGGLLVMAAVFLPLHKMGKKKPSPKSEAKA